VSTDKSITNLVLEFVATKEEVTAPEIAAFLITLARKELDVDPATYERARVAKPLLWRGSMDFAKDVIKRPRVVEELLNEDEEEEDERQEELFAGLGAFVRVDTKDGAWRFKRRRALYQDEYRASMRLLRAKSQQMIVKVERYQTELDTVLPFWAPGLTFGEAYQLASEKR
jgi:hypothetical protein